MGTLFVDKLDPQSGTALEIGSSGDTMTVPSGATFNVAGTLQSGGAAVANTPAFEAKLGSDMNVTDNAQTKVTCGTEVYDTDNAYDNSSNYRFTVPSGKAGKYLFSFNVAVASNTGVSNAKQLFVALYKNGTTFLQNFFDGRNDAYGDTFNGSASFILDCSASDYFEIYAKFNDSGSGGGNVQSGATSFSGVRLLAS